MGDWTKEIIYILIMLSVLNYIFWVGNVVNKTFDKRWHFFVGIFPVGMLVVFLVEVGIPDAIEMTSDFFSGIKYYWKS